MPKRIDLRIENLIPNSKLLPNNRNRMLEENEAAIYKLNNVSETISEIATTYKEVATTVIDSEESIYEENRNIFIDEFLNNISELSDSVIYEEVTNLENGVLDDIFKVLVEKEEIELSDLSEIFAKRNSYILGVSDKETNKYIEDDISEMIKAMNYTYKISKLSYAWKQRINENKQTLSKQLDGVSKVISTVAEELESKAEEINNTKREEIEILLKQKEIRVSDLTIRKEKNGKHVITLYTKQEDEIAEELENIQKTESVLTRSFKEKIVLQKQKKQNDDSQIQIYSSEDKYSLQIGIARATKAGSDMSGDSNLNIRLDDGKYLIALADGMGSGQQAKKNSRLSLNMLKKLLTTGFEKEASIELINSSLALNNGQDMYSSLDMCILDLYKGNSEFIKNGAACSIIKKDNEIKKIESISLPTGIMNTIDLVTYDLDISSGDIIIMCTDGVIDSKPDNSKWLEEIAENIKSQNVQKIADLILAEAIDNNYGTPKDDMTVVALKIK